jgi:hypothetical protein
VSTHTQLGSTNSYANAYVIGGNILEVASLVDRIESTKFIDFQLKI